MKIWLVMSGDNEVGDMAPVCAYHSEAEARDKAEHEQFNHAGTVWTVEEISLHEPIVTLTNALCPRCGRRTANVFDCPTCKAKAAGSVDPVFKAFEPDSVPVITEEQAAALAEEGKVLGQEIAKRMATVRGACDCCYCRRERKS